MEVRGTQSQVSVRPEHQMRSWRIETQDCRVLKASVHKALKAMGAIDGFGAQLSANMSINILKQCPLGTCILRRVCTVAWRGRSSQSLASLMITSKHFPADYKVAHHPTLGLKRNWSWRYRPQTQSAKVWTLSLLTGCPFWGKLLNLSVILFPHPEHGDSIFPALRVIGRVVWAAGESQTIWQYQARGRRLVDPDLCVHKD